MNCIGSALIETSGSNYRALIGHEILTHDGIETEVLCLSSDNDIPYVAWFHPTGGRIDAPINREDGSVVVEQNAGSGVYKLMVEGELSSEDEGVYSCRVGDINNATLFLTFGLYSDRGTYYYYTFIYTLHCGF